MNLDKNQKKLLKRYAKAVGADWFKLSTDSYGEDCVVDKDTNRKYKFEEGFKILRKFDWDAYWVLFKKENNFELIESDDTIKILDKDKQEILKSTAGMRKFFQRYTNLAEIDKLFSSEEISIISKLDTEICKNEFMQCSTTFSLLLNMKNYIEQLEGRSFMDCKANEDVKMTKIQSRLLNSFEEEI